MNRAVACAQASVKPVRPSAAEPDTDSCDPLDVGISEFGQFLAENVRVDLINEKVRARRLTFSLDDRDQRRPAVGIGRRRIQQYRARRSQPFEALPNPVERDSDWHNPQMLVSCYHAIGDEAQMRNAARMTSERVERAVAHDPTNGSAMAGGAFALAMGGDKDRAREWMRRALLLDPDNLPMRYNTACTIVQRLGDSDEALSALEPFSAP